MDNDNRPLLSSNRRKKENSISNFAAFMSVLVIFLAASIIAIPVSLLLGASLAAVGGILIFSFVVMSAMLAGIVSGIFCPKLWGAKERAAYSLINQNDERTEEIHL